jgi:phosphoribosylaminoimidazole (AIR) synthetase
VSIDYSSSGVSIEAGEALVDRIKPAVRRTTTPQVLSELGLFGGFYDASFPDYTHPILVSSTDGVGITASTTFSPVALCPCSFWTTSLRAGWLPIPLPM